MSRFRRFLTLGDGAFAWKARALATTYAGAEARSVHEDGAIIAWDGSGAVRTCVRTHPSSVAAWVDERLALVQHEPPSYQLVLHAVDEAAPRWSKFRGDWLLPIIVLPCKTMFYCDGRGRCSSEIYSIEDGSLLEESVGTERWTAIGRYARYRCVVTGHAGEVTRSWYDAEGTYEEERAPSTYSWKLERDGKTLMHYEVGLPRDARISDDDTCITIMFDGETVVALSLPDLTPMPAPASMPGEARPTLPVSKRASLDDVAEIPRRQDILTRWKIELSPWQSFLERGDELVVTSGNEVQRHRRGAETVRRWVEMRGDTECMALGGDIALVTDCNVGPESVNPASFRPTTRQLRLFSLGEGEPRLVRVLSEISWREAGSGPLLAVSADGALGVDAEWGKPVFRVWDLARGEKLETIDLGDDDDHVQAIAFGDGHRFFVETARGRVFGYSAAQDEPA